MISFIRGAQAQVDAPADFIDMSDRGQMRRLLGDDAGPCLRDLYRRRCNLYSYRNSLVARDGDGVCGAVWAVPSASIALYSVVTWLIILRSFPSSALRMLTDRRGRLTERLSKNALYVLSLSVLPRARGRGVALSMLRELDAVAQRGEHVCLELDVEVGNGPAIALYDRSGYGEVFRHSAGFGDAGCEYVRMRKGAP